VRYIKLGRGGTWEQECLQKGIIRIGFGSANAQKYRWCKTGQWEKLTRAWIEEGKDKGTATRFTNELRVFFKDDGSTLWITFVGERLWWGMMDRTPAKPHLDGRGVWRTIAGGWRSTDRKGGELTKERLSGALTKLAAYRGTSCTVDVSDYVVRRIDGQKVPEVEDAILAVKNIKSSLLKLMKLLTPRDFETLVDLVFSVSGWRRLGIVGKTQKTLDLDLMLPSTGERAFVQIKSRTTPVELMEYVGKLDTAGPFSRMFYVYHSGEAGECDDTRVTVIGPTQLAELVLDAGLVNWLIRKVS
jgi:hypothetical protein